ncbi:hypothetical protein GCM10010295_49160 [Streptomyces intermedius]
MGELSGVVADHVGFRSGAAGPVPCAPESIRRDAEVVRGTRGIVALGSHGSAAGSPDRLSGGHRTDVSTDAS